MTIYGPNNDNPAFYNKIPNILNEADYTVICGDFNIALDPSKDTENYKNINNLRARTAVLNMMEHLDLMDVYRHINPDEKRYTWRKKNSRKQARLDFFLITSHMIDIIHKANIRPGYRSDHSVTEIEIVLNRFKRGKGIWKFNNSLLKQKEYLNLINNAIQDEIFKYAIPVYNINFLNNPANYGNIDLVIDSDIFLEVLFLRLRGESIKFATFQKKLQNLKEKELINDIEYLESNETLIGSNSTLLSDKKAELEDIRKIKLEGEHVRARLQWLKEGEKPSKFLGSLENKKFVEKTIKYLELQNGESVTDQFEILNHIREYYVNLFDEKRSMDVNLIELLKKSTDIKIRDSNLGDPITVKEIGQVLKRMKNNKSSGIDGFTSEFFKVFYSKLQYFITKSINSCFKKGILSPTHR